MALGVDMRHLRMGVVYLLKGVLHVFGRCRDFKMITRLIRGLIRCMIPLVRSARIDPRLELIQGLEFGA